MNAARLDVPAVNLGGADRAKVEAFQCLLVKARHPDGQESPSWQMPETPFPWSLADIEGEILYDFIRAHQLRSGYEVATAFGYSAMYSGLALKAAGGQLNTIDAYIEEQYGSDVYVEPGQQVTRAEVDWSRQPFGLRYAQRMLEVCDLAGTVHLHRGLSPEDVPAIIGQSELDYVFVDGAHFGEQPTADIQAVINNLAPKYALFFHDHHQADSSVGRAVRWAQRELAHRYGRPQMYWLMTVYRLTVLTNLSPTPAMRLLLPKRAPPWRGLLSRVRRRLVR